MSTTPPPASQRVQTATATIWRHAAGYLVVDQVEGATQTGESAREMFDAARLLVASDEWLPMLVLANRSRTDRSARAEFATIGVSHTAAVALVIRSKVAKITGNFFLRINQPDFPVQLFESSEDAVEWLTPYVGRSRDQ